MQYDTIVQVSQIASLILFMALFAAAVLYAFWPGNQKGFDEAARLPLAKDEDDLRQPNGSQA
jgi:cytochrome c oxidase cbb3-type subunit IV